MYEFRNARFSSADNLLIDAEINHQEYGWIPHTVASGTELFESMAAEADDYSPPIVTAIQVNRERDRRIDAGFSFGGNQYQSGPDDRENIAGAATAALGAIINGAQAGDYRWHGGDEDFVWIASDNTTHQMDAQTMYALGQAALAHKQAHIFAARALKDTVPIPSDFTDDGHWPA
ncbi:DUF4376 domain-containing protein [Martelella sp. FLE1502]